jgi:hypothetical protein
VEGDGFELPVPRAMQARLNAKIAGSSCAVRNSRGRNYSFGGRRGVGIGSPITRNRGLSTVRKIVVGADVVIGLSSLIFPVSLIMVKGGSAPVVSVDTRPGRFSPATPANGRKFIPTRVILLRASRPTQGASVGTGCPMPLGYLSSQTCSKREPL